MNQIAPTPERRQRIEEAIRQTDAIFSFEGFEPTEEIRAVDAAVLAGRITFKQAADEMTEYAMRHKTLDGFIQSRTWAA